MEGYHADIKISSIVNSNSSNDTLESHRRVKNAHILPTLPPIALKIQPGGEMTTASMVASPRSSAALNKEAITLRLTQHSFRVILLKPFDASM